MLLEKEKIRILEDFDILANTLAYTLYEKDMLFAGNFVKFDNNGHMIIKFHKDRSIPMTNEYLWAIILKQEHLDFNVWRKYSYQQLYNKALEFSSVQCIWKSKGNEKNVVLAGFTGVSLELSERLKAGNTIILGPPEPPILYYENLKAFINKYGLEYGAILQPSEEKTSWQPSLVNNETHLVTYLQNQLALEDTVLVQGPPGTGKTTLIARIIKELINQNKSVLVTALANKALMEVASHDELQPLLDKQLIYKTNLSEDEKIAIANLKSIKDVVPQKGKLILSTFYKSSSLFELPKHNPFDYIIVDEASQAFLGTLAGFSHIGENNIWVGDQVQLPPVVQLNKDEIRRLGVKQFIHGFETVCNKDMFPGFMMNKTFRFGQRGAEFTGIFYDNQLASADKKPLVDLENLSFHNKQLFHPQGGPSLLKIELELSIKTPLQILAPLTNLLTDIFSNYPYEVLIVAPFRKTVGWLEKSLNHLNTKKLSVSTIDKIQGKNTDICIFIIPNVKGLYAFELNLNRFNVATSRAKYHSLIIADKNVLTAGANSKVTEYLNRLDKEDNLNLLH